MLPEARFCEYKHARVLIELAWQALWMLVGLDFSMAILGPREGNEGLISSNPGVYAHLWPIRSTCFSGTPMSPGFLVGSALSGRAWPKQY